MTKILILGGNSFKNKEWVDSLANLLSCKKTNEIEVIGHCYSHWSTEGGTMDFKKELGHIASDLKSGEDYFIVAKSAGAILCLNGVFCKLIKPKACIFMGLAVNWAKENNIWEDDWIRDFSIPTLYIHNSDDPAIEADHLKKMLKNYNKNYKIEVWNEHGHKYENFGEISNAIYSFIDKIQK